MRIAIVILHFNRPADVIDSLRRMHALRARHAFVVVDNGSRPECVAELRAAPEMEGVKLIAMTHNVGSCAWDFGAVESGADVAIKLDDDSHIEADSLTVLEERFAAEPDLGALALAIEGGPFPCRDRPSFRRGTSVGFIGCGVAIRVEALQQSGGHDPNIFIYADEWDLAVRLLNAGYEIDWEGRVPVFHRTARASGRTPARLVVYTVRNEVLIVRKYFRHTRFFLLLTRVAIWNINRFFPSVGWRVFPMVTKGMSLGLSDMRLVAVSLRDPRAMFARYEKWYGAFRPLHRFPELLIRPPHWAVRCCYGAKMLFSRGRRERVAIFGASRAGVNTFRRLRGNQSPVCFLDNDVQRQGGTLLGRPIYAPERLPEILDGIDRILVGSMFAPEILAQLSALGVPDEKLAVGEDLMMSGSYLTRTGVRAEAVVVDKC